MKKEKKAKQVGVRLPPDLEALVATVSEQTNLSVAEVIRLCIERQVTEIAKDGGIILKVHLPQKSK